MAETVFVSGATGFIAQHIIKQLIESNYNVVGAVRNAEKGEILKRHLGSDKFQYEIVEDLAKEGVFDKPLEKHPEATIFLHTASPVVFGGDDPEKDLLLPAINGTKGVLNAIKEYAPQIKKVVITSSYAAINASVSPRAIKSGTVTEETWTDLTYEEALLNHITAYAGSKTFAEKAAWDFYKKENPSFTLSVVNPVYVFGPQAFDESAKGDLNFSADLVTSFLKLTPKDVVPSMIGSFIDVRDVAKAHIVAFTSKEAIGKRLVVLSNEFNQQTVLDVLREQFPELRDNLPIGDPSNTKVELPVKDDTSFTKKVLGFKYIDIKTSIYDTVKQYLDVNK